MKTLLFTIFMISSHSYEKCSKCDMDIVVAIQNSSGRATSDQIDQFLCTFSRSCNYNIEFMEVSGQTLYTLVEIQPELFLHSLKFVNKDSREEIFARLAKPVDDAPPLSLIRERISKYKTKYTAKVLQAIDIAISKYKKD